MTRPLCLFPTNFSPSMLADIDRCEMHFFRKHCQKLHVKTTNGDLEAGRVFAKACEIVRNKYYFDELPSYEAIEHGQNYIYSCDEIASDVKSIDKLAQNLEYYFNEFPLTDLFIPAKLSDGNYAIEYEFVFDLGIPHPDIPKETIKIKGILDAIYLIGEKYYIVDEKTTKNIFRLPKSHLIDYEKEKNAFRLSTQLMCLTPEHEVLTKNGWVYIDKLEKNKEILCWEPDKFFWDVPYSYIEKDVEENLIEYQGLNRIVGTKNHRQPVFNRQSKSYSTFTLDSIPLTKDLWQFQSGSLLEKEDNLNFPNPVIQLIVAIQADGCWSTDCKNPAIQFSFSKTRKVNRLLELLKLAEITDYTYYTYKDKSYSTDLRHDFRINDRNFTKKIWTLIGKNKSFNSWLLELGTKQLQIFIAELGYWDGYYNKNKNLVYSSTNWENIQWVQTICCLLNLNGNIQENTNAIKSIYNNSCWNIIITSRTKRAVSRQKKTSYFYKGKVYCVNVPSSYFLIRYKGTTTITGNCYSWALEQLGIKDSEALIRRVPFLKDYEPAFELAIPITQFMRNNWSIFVYNRIIELIDKYQHYKHSGEIPQNSFNSSYGEGCNKWGYMCPYNSGCIHEEGEEELLSRYEQAITAKDSPPIPLETKMKELGLI